MCHALPARVTKLLEGDHAQVDLGGIRKTISLGLVEDVAVGDYVVVHVGYALAKLDPVEAARSLELMTRQGESQGDRMSVGSGALEEVTP